MRLRTLLRTEAHWFFGFVLAVLFTFAAFLVLRGYEQRAAQAEFQSSASERLDDLAGSMRLALAHLDALGAYFDATPHVDRALFQQLARPLLDEKSPIVALEWVPRVPNAERASMIESARQDGLPQFDFTERDASGALIPVGTRPEYFPVYFMAPYRSNEAALGFDLSTNPARRAALMRAIETRGLVATGAVTLVQDPSVSNGFLVFRPVFSSSSQSVTHKPIPVRGLVLGVFRISRMTSSADADPQSVKLVIFDDSAPRGQHLLYPKGLAVDSPAELSAPYRLTRTLTVADRTWTVVALPQAGAFPIQRSVSTVTLVLGLLLSVLWAVFLRQRAQRQAFVERMVEKRTLDLKHERNFNRAILDSAGSIVMVINRQAEIIRFNTRAETFTGFTADEVAGQPFFWELFLLPEQRASVREVFAHFLAGNISSRVETHWLNQAGESHLFDWSNTILLDDQGVPEYLVTVGIDVTDARKNAEALHIESEKNRVLLRNASDGIHILDIDGNLIEASDSFFDMLGYSREEMLDMNVSCWDVQFTPEEALHKLREQLTGPPERIQFETRHRKKDGTVFDVEVSGFPLELNGRRVLFGSSRDISLRKQIEAALRESELRYRSIIDASPVPHALNNDQQQVTYLNAAFTQVFGYTIADVPTLADWWTVAYPDPDYRAWVSKRWQEHVEKSLREGSEFEPMEVHIRCKNGETRFVVAADAPLIAAHTDDHLVTLFDITELKRTEHALKESEMRFRQMFERNNAAMLLIDPHTGNIIDANLAACDFYGWSHDELCRMNISSINQLSADEVELERQLAAKELRNYFVFPHRLSDGSVRTVEVHTTPIEVGGRELLISIIHDISARLEAEARVQQLLHEQSVMLDNTIVGFVRVQDRTMTWTNQAFDNMLGYGPGELSGQSTRKLYADEATYIDFGARAYPTILVEGYYRGEVQLCRADGQLIWCNASGGLLDVETGESLWIFLDITDHKRSEDEIRQLAYFDPLTQLPNRRLLIDRLNQALISSQRRGEYGALMMLDMDHFKGLNDTLGHDVGDSLLKEVAVRLSSCVRQEDTVARLGGDEYVVLLEGLGSEETTAVNRAMQVAEKIRSALSAPYFLGPQNTEYHTTSSTGLTLFLGRDETVDVLLKHADLALYQAKDAGRNTVRFFSPAMQAEIETRAAMEAALRQGLVRGEFMLHYQPQVDQIGRLVGVEALIRWQSPDHGLVPPTEFIPLAEETGLILDIGQWVMDMACAQLKRWGENPLTCDISLSINVSARQFRQSDFVDCVRKSLSEHEANPARLILELTEGTVLKDVDLVVAQMRELTELGIGFSLDDFGTGYSSLSYLKRLPLSQVKIDKSFVRDLTVDPSDAAIVRAILAMGHSLGLQTIAEGVETAEQREFLSENGCVFYQGYLFGRPGPIENIDRLIDEGTILL